MGGRGGKWSSGPGPGYRDNLASVKAKGGGRHDVLMRVVRLMKFAEKYGVYVILTSWEYQDCTLLVADAKIRAEVMGIPEPQCFMHMALTARPAAENPQRGRACTRISPISRSTTSPIAVCSRREWRARICTGKQLPCFVTGTTISS